MEVQAKRPTTKGPTDWFTGDVYVDPIAQNQGPSPVSLGAVHFAPSAHTAWHRHSLGQSLFVTEGEGLVQPRGAQPIRIRPGDVIVIAPGEWHWHGATATTFMTHLALTEGDTEWGEHLTEREYAAATE